MISACKTGYRHSLINMKGAALSMVRYCISRASKIHRITQSPKHDDFDFDIVNFPFLDGDIPRATSYGVYIS